MATLVSFHAHPDDESIGTGGSMIKAAADGHRVIIVTATRGEHGLVPEGVAGEGEPLAELRVQELAKAAEIIGASRVEYLDYVDSGMAGDELNEVPHCFWQADVEEAAQKLAAILQEENADVITFYDENGVYGHPDHIQVNRVGMRAAEIAGVPNRYMSTVNRDKAQVLWKEIMETEKDRPVPGGLADGEFKLGVPGDRITTVVDVKSVLKTKQAAMAAHASQISPDSFFIGLPDHYSQRMWGEENFIRIGAPTGYSSTDLFEGIE